MTETRWVVVTVKQPWASLIVCGRKPVENRSWAPRYRGPLYIHAAASDDRAAWRALSPAERAAVAELGPVARSAIIGAADLVDVVEDVSLPYAVAGCRQWVLAGARCLRRPVPARGQLSLWRFDAAKEGPCR